MNNSRIIEYKDFENPLPGESRVIDTLAPPDLARIIAAVKSAPNSGKFDVRGVNGLKDPVYKFDTLTFDDQATLIIEATDAEFIALAVNEMVLDIKNPQYKAFISRPIGVLEQNIVAQLSGANGFAGSYGTNGTTIDRRGQPGGNGHPGANGGPGKTKNLPPVFFFVQKLIFGNATTPGRQYLYLNFQGFPGGNGGKGGNGGAGGRGGDGEHGALGPADCKEGGGPGGNGGNAASGGQGGDSGDGSDGATVYLFAPDGSMFNFSTGNIEGGRPGLPGRAGLPGSPGAGGSGAAAVGFCPFPPCCKAEQNGRRGAPATPPNFGEGVSGVQGARGSQHVTVRDNSDLF